MAIKIGQEFERTSKATRFKDDVMTKAQMLAGTDDKYSDGYLVVEKDSHDLYIYDSNATPSETGKFVKSSGSGGSSDYSDLTNKPKINSIELNGDKKAEDLEIKTFGRYENEDVYGIHTYTDFFGFKSDKSIQGYGSWGFAYDSSVKDVVMINSEYEPADNHQIQRRLPTREGVNILLADKADKTEIPTKTSDLTNDSNFQTETEVQTKIDDAISGVTQFTYEVVASLPTTGEKGKIYLVENTSGEYDEYIWMDGTPGKFEKIGSVNDVDLSNYYTKTEVDTAISNAKQVELNSTNGWLEFKEQDGTNLAEMKPNANGISFTGVDEYGDSREKHLASTYYVDTKANTKQDTLVSGTNIKTINNQSLLEGGNLDIVGVNEEFVFIDIPPDILTLDEQSQTQTYAKYTGTLTTFTKAQLRGFVTGGKTMIARIEIPGSGTELYKHYDLKFISSIPVGNIIFSGIFDTKRFYVNAQLVISIGSDDVGNPNIFFELTSNKWGEGGSLPSGGTTGQALVKKSNTDGDVERKTVGGESTIDKIEVNGVEQPIVNKTVDIEVPEVSMQSYDNMSITPAGASSGFVFNVNTDNVTVTTESGTKTLPTKTYVDSKSPTIVNEGATFTNAAGNQQMQIKTGGVNSVIIKDVATNGTAEYWSYELPAKPYVDTELAKKGNTNTIFDNEYKTLQIRDVNDSVEFQVVKETSNDYVRMNEYAKDDRGQMQQIFDVNLPTKTYVDTLTGDLSTLTTTDQSNLVNAINEVYEKSGEPFRVKNWAASWSAGVSIDPCTTDKTNANLSKMTYSIDAVEGADYQIVGMVAYEVFDNTSGGNRLNVWPVCQFTGNGQKELSVRWVCAGTTVKTAKRINAWVLLKHR